MSQAIVIAEESELIEEAKGLAPIVDAAKAFEVTGPVTYELAIERIRLAKKHRAAFDAKRKEITGPILLAKRRVDDLFRPVLGALEAIETEYRTKSNHYISEQAKARQEAAEAAALAIGTGDAPLVPPPPSALKTHTIEYWVVHVSDPDLVPREFCCPDYDKLQAIANAEGRTRTIPGVTFERKERLVVR